MIPEWLADAGPWPIAESEMDKDELGTVVEVCIHEVMPPRSGRGTVHTAVDQWKKRLTERFGDISLESTLETARSTSLIARFGRAPIVRVFVDQAGWGIDSSLDFEIIGTRRSFIFRSNKGLCALHALNDKEEVIGRTFSHVNVASDLEGQVPITDPPINLGVMSIDHPHAAGNHFPALGHLSERVRVAAIAHPVKEECERWLHHFGARHFATNEELLADREIDAVLVTSENWHHAQDAMNAIAAQKDVFCDKPIATTEEDCLELVRRVRQSKRRFVTTYPVRLHPAVLALRESILRGDLGEIEAVVATNHGCMYEPGVPAWVLDPVKNGGGCIIDHTVHVADLIRFLTGREFVDIRTFADSILRGISAEDIAVCHGQMTGGAIYQIDCSWSRKAGDPSWGDVTVRVVGSKGAASLDLYNNYRVEVSGPEGIQYRFPNSLIYDHANVFMDYWREKTSGTRSTNADEVDGLRTMELVFASYESVRQEKTVEVTRHDVA